MLLRMSRCADSAKLGPMDRRGALSLGCAETLPTNVHSLRAEQLPIRNFFEPSRRVRLSCCWNSRRSSSGGGRALIAARPWPFRLYQRPARFFPLAFLPEPTPRRTFDATRRGECARPGLWHSLVFRRSGSLTIRYNPNLPDVVRDVVRRSHPTTGCISKSSLSD
jgi:hypothetical protein